MKKMLVLTLALLLCGTALASAGLFTLRGDIAWGMTPDEVLAVEGPAKYEWENLGSARVLEIEDLRLEGRECDLDYLFRDDALAAARYEFDAEDFDVQAVADGLDATYGARGDGDSGRIADLLGALTGMDLAPLDAAARKGGFYYDWTAGDGSYVALTNLSPDDGDDVYVFHFDTREAPAE